MPDSRITEFKVGLVVVAAFVALLVGVWWIAGPRLVKEAEQLCVEFHFVRGLSEGSPVKQAGVDVGYVESMRRAPERRAVVVTCKIFKDTVLYEGITAHIASTGVIGDYYLELDFGTGRSHLELPTTINGEDPYTIDDVLEKGVALLETAPELIGGAVETLEKLNAALGDPEDLRAGVVHLVTAAVRIESILGSIQSATGSIADITGAVSGLNKAVADFQNLLTGASPKVLGILDNIEASSLLVKETTIPKVDNALEDVRLAARDMRESSAFLRDLLRQNESRVNQTMASVQVLAASAESLARRIEVLVEGVERGEGVVGRILQSRESEEKVDSILDNTSDATTRLRSFLHPHAVGEFRFHGRGTERYPHGQGFRADAGLEFELPADSWLFIGANDIGRDDELELTAGHVFWDRANLYAGAIESEAAIGLELMLHDRFSLVGEVIGLTDEDEERLDLFGKIRLHRYGSVLFGVEDVGDDNLLTGGVQLRI